jgi:hypothetical protein
MPRSDSSGASVTASAKRLTLDAAGVHAVQAA